ncbi:MAG: hypothetical protein JNL65_12670 [Saprospiraceae bacterium]|nr:hypothetical protein [Saprospiraceae bacterium]
MASIADRFFHLILKPFIYSFFIFGFMNICSAADSIDNVFLKDSVIKGVLSFPNFSWGSYYGGVDSIIIRADNELDRLEQTDSALLTPNDVETLNIYGRLRKTKLLYRPFFHLQTDSSEYIVYIDSLAYENINIYNKKELEKENSIVEIELIGEFINLGSFDVIKCNKLLRVRKMIKQSKGR